MKQFALRILAFLSVFVLAMASELLLPIDFFHFRVWEAASVGRLALLLPGPFYPNLSFETVEEGDLGHHTTFAVRKKTSWETDQYGYRTANQSDGAVYDVVIIGDSNVVGSGSTQDNALSEVLGRKIGKAVYPLAPADIHDYLSAPRFKSHPPKLVIFERIERALWEMPVLSANSGSNTAAGDYEIRCLPDDELYLGQRREPGGPFVMDHHSSKHVVPEAMYGLVTLADRLYKRNAWRWIRARLDATPTLGTTRGGERFLGAESANRPVDGNTVACIVNTLITYRDIITQRGSRFIFLPVPNKENALHDLLNDSRRPIFLDDVVRQALEADIATVDIQDSFQKARGAGADTFFPDDTHWSPAGIEIAAEQLAAWIHSTTAP